MASVDVDLGKALPSITHSASPTDRIAYARDLWPRHHIAVADGRIAEHAPGSIAWPASTEEVASLVSWCASEGVPLVPFGAGSGVCGGILPDSRVVVMDMKRMKRWRALDRDAPSIEVESGALGVTFEEDLNREGLSLGHFPSSILCSTVGGWVAGRSAGQCSGRYGKIEDMVASLECVVGRGEIVRLERRAHGPDLTPLMIGSEGVLGVVTAATLRLHRMHTSRAFSAYSFPAIEAGYAAMREMFQAGLRPAVSRLYDAFDSMIAKMGAVRRGKKAKDPKASHAPHAPGRGAAIMRGLLRVPGALNGIVDAIGPRVMGGSTLVLIFEGDEAEAHEDSERAAAIAARLGGRSLGEEPARRWLSHRYSVSYRQAPMFMAGAFADTMEVAASWSRLDELYRSVREALGKHVFVMAHLSHAYPDGCSIYFTFAGSAKTPAEAEATYDAAWRAALDAAIASGGTLSHHHGVGRSKAPKLGGELGLGVDVVHALRGALDPAGIMNPGNLMPRESPARRAAEAPPAAPLLDRTSHLIAASGSATLAEIERAAQSGGLSLGLDAGAPPLDSTTLAAWIAGGTHGARDAWSDPADHLVAGFTAQLASGADLTVRPAPRRAVGPDLFALFHGMSERVGVVTSAHVRVHGPSGARVLSTSIDRDPPLGDAERGVLDRIVESTRKVG